MEYDKMAIGRRIKTIRRNLGLTLEEFGLLIDDSSKSNVSKWENGVSIPNNKRLKLIASLGKMPVQELLTGSPEDTLNSIENYIDEIMHQEIREFNSEKYKLLYDPLYKQKIISTISERYNFEGLTEIGVKQYIKEALDYLLSKDFVIKKYLPFSDENAKAFTIPA